MGQIKVKLSLSFDMPKLPPSALQRGRASSLPGAVSKASTPRPPPGLKTQDPRPVKKKKPTRSQSAATSSQQSRRRKSSAPSATSRAESTGIAKSQVRRELRKQVSFRSKSSTGAP